MKKRAVSMFLVVVMAISLFSTMCLSASAANAYRADKALAYAQSHWNDGKGLCAEFASKCLQAGGCNVSSAGCTTLVRQLQNGGYGDLVKLTVSSDGRIPASKNSGKVLPGDPIFYYCSKETDGYPYVHVVICGGTKSGYLTGYSHNRAMNNETIYATRCGYCNAKLSAVYAFRMKNSTAASNTAGTAGNGLKTGVYYNIINLKSGDYLNVYGSSSKNNANIDTYERDFTSGEKFKLTYSSSGWYTITPACATSRRVNVYTSSAVKNGNNICTWSATGNSSQGWLFEQVSGGYVIRSANNPNLVMTATGTSNSSNVKLATYQAGNTYQIWKLAVA